MIILISLQIYWMKNLSGKDMVSKSSKIKNWEEAGIMYNHALKKIHDYPRIKRVHGN